jgi:hypothetical protein
MFFSVLPQHNTAFSRVVMPLYWISLGCIVVNAALSSLAHTAHDGAAYFNFGVSLSQR